MKKTGDDNLRTVYSTELGRICPGCGKPADSCECRKNKNETPLGDGIVRLRRETKGRGGKTVIVITGLPLKSNELEALGKKLKKRCGTGGCVKNGVIEIQGEHRDSLMSELAGLGYKVKQTGG